jgi:hypothetical protein
MVADLFFLGQQLIGTQEAREFPIPDFCHGMGSVPSRALYIYTSHDNFNVPKNNKICNHRSKHQNFRSKKRQNTSSASYYTFTCLFLLVCSLQQAKAMLYVVAELGKLEKQLDTRKMMSSPKLKPPEPRKQ